MDFVCPLRFEEDLGNSGLGFALVPPVASLQLDEAPVDTDSCACVCVYTIMCERVEILIRILRDRSIIVMELLGSVDLPVLALMATRDKS